MTHSLNKRFRLTIEALNISPLARLGSDLLSAPISDPGSKIPSLVIHPTIPSSPEPSGLADRTFELSISTLLKPGSLVSCAGPAEVRNTMYKTLGPLYKEMYLAAVRAVVLTDQQPGNPPGTGSDLFRKRTHHEDSSSSLVPVVGSIKATWICTVENLSIKSSKKSNSIHPLIYPLLSYCSTFPSSLPFIILLALRPYGPYIDTSYLSFTIRSFVN